MKRVNHIDMHETDPALRRASWAPFDEERCRHKNPRPSQPSHGNCSPVQGGCRTDFQARPGHNEADEAPPEPNDATGRVQPSDAFYLERMEEIEEMRRLLACYECAKGTSSESASRPRPFSRRLHLLWIRWRGVLLRAIRNAMHRRAGS